MVGILESVWLKPPVTNAISLAVADKLEELPPVAFDWLIAPHLPGKMYTCCVFFSDVLEALFMVTEIDDRFANPIGIWNKHNLNGEPCPVDLEYRTVSSVAEYAPLLAFTTVVPGDAPSLNVRTVVQRLCKESAVGKANVPAMDVDVA